MRPANDWEEQLRRTRFKELLRQSDIEFDERSMVIYWADPTTERSPEGRIEVNFTGEALTFEALEDLSALFKTRNIDIGCEHGTGSDPCHERVITIYGAQGL